jgi:5-methylcytosine-specific restriction endonuclease McrA
MSKGKRHRERTIGEIWLPVDERFVRHPKVLKAARQLETTPFTLMGHLITFWLYVARFLPDGHIGGWDPELVHFGSRWPGDAEQFARVLVDVGLLDWDGEELRCHDWSDHVRTRPQITALRKEWERLAPRLRGEIFERDGYRCQICGGDSGPFEIDHVLPLARGGTNDLDNLQTTCFSCNRSKGARR